MNRVLLTLTSLTLGLVSTPCLPQDVGRLFFTPEQRAALDARRKSRVPDKPAAVVVASPTTRVDGFVKRSTGPSTVWVNGEPLPEGPGEAPRIGPRVSIPLGEGGRRATLRPGEVLDRGTGEVRDVIGDGEIRIRRSP
jgi:hypothetical protein